MGKKGKGRAVKRNAHRPGHGNEEDEVSRAPHSFVVPLGKTSKCVRELVSDFRHVMEPFTASKIKARPGNVVKDYVHVAGVLNVTHMVGFTKTDLGPYIKIARLPRGPTLTFRYTTTLLMHELSEFDDNNFFNFF
jgi:ribosome biogenesis protein SSF1/2